MKKDQRIVAIGAASGVVLMAAGVWELVMQLPAPALAGLPAERLAYALRANVFALLPLFVMIAAVGNSRFQSEAIDPTRHAESQAMQIDGRVVENTLQQNFLFAIASLALSTVVPVQDLQILWALAIVFVIARTGFWIGYRINPLYRAPGMSATAYMNLGMIAYVLFRTLLR